MSERESDVTWKKLQDDMYEAGMSTEQRRIVAEAVGTICAQEWYRGLKAGLGIDETVA